MAAAGHSSSSDSAPLQVIWTPNMGCHIRVSLATGEPEYDTYKKTASWVTCRVLRTVGDDGQVAYPPAVFPRNAPIASLRVPPLLLWMLHAGTPPGLVTGDRRDQQHEPQLH